MFDRLRTNSDDESAETSAEDSDDDLGMNRFRQNRYAIPMTTNASDDDESTDTETADDRPGSAETVATRSDLDLEDAPDEVREQFEEVIEEVIDLLSKRPDFTEEELREMTFGELEELVERTDADDLADPAEADSDAGDTRQNTTDGDPQGYGNDMYADGCGCGCGGEKRNAAPTDTISAGTRSDWEQQQADPSNPTGEESNRARQRQRHQRSRTNYAGVSGKFSRDVPESGEQADVSDVSAGTRSEWEQGNSDAEGDGDAGDDDLPPAGTRTNYEERQGDESDTTPSWDKMTSPLDKRREAAAKRHGDD